MGLLGGGGGGLFDVLGFRLHGLVLRCNLVEGCLCYEGFTYWILFWVFIVAL